MRRASLTARTLRVTIATGHEFAAMPSGPSERYDFFLSRRGSVASIAREVADVLTEEGYKVLVQDYDIPLTANFIEEMQNEVPLVVVRQANGHAQSAGRQGCASHRRRMIPDRLPSQVGSSLVHFSPDSCE
jgi:hypothetical protein